MKVACAQLAPVIGEVAGNRLRSVRAIELAARAGARLVVLPELCNSGYVFADRAEAFGLAETVVGPTVAAWAELSARHGLVVIGGLCERRGDGRLGNTAVTIDGGAVVSVYRKTHLWDRELDVFTPGELPPPVVGTSVGSIGVAVCYDAFFPEVMRSLALAGAHLIAVPMNTPVLEPRLQPLAAEVALAISSAVCNRVFVAQCDRTGDERDVRWVGCSAVVDPDGRLMTERTDGEAVLLAEVELTTAARKQVGARNHVLADRRPELYRTAPSGPSG